MTRGRHCNDAFVVVDEDTDAVDLLRRSVDGDWFGRSALVVRTELFDPNAPARRRAPMVLGGELAAGDPLSLPGGASGPSIDEPENRPEP